MAGFSNVGQFALGNQFTEEYLAQALVEQNIHKVHEFVQTKVGVKQIIFPVGDGISFVEEVIDKSHTVINSIDDHLNKISIEAEEERIEDVLNIIVYRTQGLIDKAAGIDSYFHYSLMKMLTTMWTYLNETCTLEMSYGTGKMYGQLVKEHPEYLSNLLKQIKIIVASYVVFIQASRWVTCLQKENFKNVVDFWSDDFTDLYFMQERCTPTFCILNVQNEIIWMFLLKKAGRLSIKDEKGYTILHRLIKKNSLDKAEEVLAIASAQKLELIDVLGGPKGQTAMHIATNDNNIAAIKLLISFGACYNELDESQKPPAWICRDHVEMSQIFTRISKMFAAAYAGTYQDFHEKYGKKEDRKIWLYAREYGSKNSIYDVIFKQEKTKSTLV